MQCSLEKAGTVTNNSARTRDHCSAVLRAAAHPRGQPGGGHRPRHGRRLLLAGLHQQRAARASQPGASAATRRSTASPSGPPSSALARLVVARLGGHERHLRGGHVRRVADQDADPAAQRAGQRANRSPGRRGRRPARRCAGRTRPRPGRCRPRATRAPPSATATARPSAPVPQHRSTITGARRREPARPRWRRGTRCGGAARTPQGRRRSAARRTPPSRPLARAAGRRPAVRRARRVRPGCRAAAASSRASSSAKTHPAARSRATTAGSASVVIPMDYACGLVAAATRINRRPHAWHPAPIAVTGPGALLAR